MRTEVDTTTITDYCGNTFLAARLNEQESPGFDTFGARKDQAWKALGSIMADVAADVPRVGDAVRVTKGRKHIGKTGIVFWRGNDPFAGRQYGSDMQRAMSDAMGYSDRLGIKTDSGEKFFTPLRNCIKAEGSAQ